MSMKNRFSGKMMRRMLLGLLLVCLVTAANANTASAATTKYMKKLKGISWDLKAGKKVIYQSNISGIGMHDQKAKITNWKITDGEEGYKKLTFKVTFDHRWSVSKSQVHTIGNSSLTSKTGDIGALAGYWIVDYNTGTNLELENNEYGVTVSDSGWTTKNTKYYRDSHGCYVYLSVNTTKVTIVYPENYKGLTIGICGSTKLKMTRGDKKFIAGKVPFGKTSYYAKKNKKVAHFMRVK